ncbi:MAG: 6-phosphogluconolactonase [Rhodobacteraceae bacterium]|nr:6-phosphogluconolactonase [Paracoccaceae bacterium]
MRRLVEYPDRELMLLDVANQLAGELADCLRRQKTACFCVPGGSTPGPVFDVLSEQALDWNRVSVILNDERWVPESHPRSNTRLLRERLLVSRAAVACLVPLCHPAATPEGGIDSLIAGVREHLPISVLLLGMGADMHTASLFPGADRLAEALAPDAPILMPMRAASAGEPRITLTAPVLNAAMSRHIILTGREKRDALDRAAHLDPMQAPIRAVWSDAVVHWAE